MNNPTYSDLPIGEEPAPLVDEALDATHHNDARQPMPRLKSETLLLGQSVSDVGTAAIGDFRENVRARPLAAAVAVAFLAFVYGATR